jgi:hypothetical protein
MNYVILEKGGTSGGAVKGWFKKPRKERLWALAHKMEGKMKAEKDYDKAAKIRDRMGRVLQEHYNLGRSEKVQKARVQVKPYSRKGRIVSGYSAERKAAAFKMGVDAFHAGKKPIPVLDKEFMDTFIQGAEVGSSSPAMEAYIRGWHKENLKVGEAQEPYGRKLTTESGQKLRSQTKIAQQIEQNQTTAVKFLRPELKRSVNNLLHGLGTYHNEIPLKQVFDILNQHGLTALQEDGTEWEGFLLGRDGQLFLDVAPLGSKRVWAGPTYEDKAGKTQVIPDVYVYDKVKNTSLNMSWHTMDVSGRYEILAYLS